MVMYRTPAALASDTHVWASNLTGSKVDASHSYVPTGIFWFSITHSARPSRLYTPQWMNRPNLASRNHSRAASRTAGTESAAGVGALCCAPSAVASATSATSARAAIVSILFRMGRVCVKSRSAARATATSLERPPSAEVVRVIITVVSDVAKRKLSAKSGAS